VKIPTKDKEINRQSQLLKGLGLAAAILLGVVILVVSWVRAGLVILAIESRDEEIRVLPIRFAVDRGEGEIEWYAYKIPEAGMLPGNMLYGVKEVRNDLWLAMSRSPEEKKRLLLLMADKKIAEANSLIKSGKNKLALKAGRKALDKLKYSKQVAEATEKNNGLEERIFQAGYAYKMVLGAMKFEKGERNDEYNKLIDELDRWNEEQREEKESREEQ